MPDKTCRSHEVIVRLVKGVDVDGVSRNFLPIANLPKTKKTWYLGCLWNPYALFAPRINWSYGFDPYPLYINETDALIGALELDSLLIEEFAQKDGEWKYVFFVCDGLVVLNFYLIRDMRFWLF